MPITNFYNNNGLGQLQPGNLTRSDSHQINAFYPFSGALYAQTTLAVATYPVNTSNSFSISISTTGEVYSGNIIVGATLDSNDVVRQMNSILPNLYVASFNPTTNLYVIDTAVPGSNGIFITNGATANTTTPGASSFLRAGRLVVPSGSADPNNGLRIRNNPYRYPLTTDPASVIAAGVFVIKDAHTNIARFALPYNIGQVTNGTPFAGLRQGEIIVQPITALTAVSSLFVETNTVGDLAGRITSTATATTVAIPAGKLQVVGTTTAANQLARVQIL